MTPFKKMNVIDKVEPWKNDGQSKTLRNGLMAKLPMALKTAIDYSKNL